MAKFASLYCEKSFQLSEETPHLPCGIILPVCPSKKQSPLFHACSPVADLPSPAAESLSPGPAPPSIWVLFLGVIRRSSLKFASPVRLVEGAMHQFDL